ncbi:MAG: hypothetical protein ABSC06_23870 [Rhodopila sp.]|jgi:hypothetical protein
MLDEVVQELRVSKMTVIRMIHTKTLPARQVCPGAPCIILRKDLELPSVRSAPPKAQYRQIFDRLLWTAIT